MKKTQFRAIVGALCAALALVGGLVLTGCSGANPEEAIRADLTTNFDEIKNLDDAAIEELAEEMGSTGLEDYGVDTADLITSMAEGFDYTIDSITVNDDAATASVTVTSKSMSELMDVDPDTMTADLLSAIASGEVDATDDDSVNAWTGEYMMNLVDAIEPSEKSLELTYVNGDDGWALDESSNDAVEQIFV